MYTKFLTNVVKFQFSFLFPSTFFTTYSEFYRVIQKERSIFWQVIVSVIVKKKVHMIMCLVLNCYSDGAVRIWRLNPLDF